MEVLFVVAVVGIIAAIAMMSQSNVKESAKLTKLETDVATINSAIQLYLANGGSLTGLSVPQDVLDKMKTERRDAAKFAGMRNSMLDKRLRAIMQSGGEANTKMPRAIWNTSKMRFEVATKGSNGVSMFLMDDALASVDYGTEERSNHASPYNTGDGWIWSYTEDSPTAGPQPTDIPLPGGTSGSGSSGLGGTAGGGTTGSTSSGSGATGSGTVGSGTVGSGSSGSGSTSSTGSTGSDTGSTGSDSSSTGSDTSSTGSDSSTSGDSGGNPQAGDLQPPAVLPAGGRYAASQFDLTVFMTNPNSDDTWVMYSVNGSTPIPYAGPFTVSQDTTVAAYATGLPSKWNSSAPVSHTYTKANPQKLLTPIIAQSAANFVADSVESISVVLTDPNPTGSALQYRIDGGAWTDYTAVLVLTRVAYPSGASIVARAITTSSDFLDSGLASATIGLTPVQLQSPAVTPSAAAFVAGSVETISITMTNPNTSGSVLKYRLNGGRWQVYSSAFNVTRATYPSGLLVEGLAEASSTAYLDSAAAAATIGLTAVQLQTPSITPSASAFRAGSMESISITMTNPNAAGSALEYRLDDGDWQPYSGAFNVTRAIFPSGLLVEGRARATSAAYLDSAEAMSTIDLTAVQLQTPVLTPSATAFRAGSVGTISVTMTNPNAAGSALEYRLAGGAWQAYSSAFNVTLATYPSGLLVEGRARATSAAYLDSGVANSTIGLTAVQLQTPAVTPSASNFAAGSLETISVTMTNPNATGSTLQYRLNGGSWQNYSSAFNVTRATYPSGLTVEGRAKASSAAYLDSAVASAAIGLSPVQLQAPAIAKSAVGFTPGVVETIQITLTNPNATGSTLQYRLNGGSWQAYSSAFNVTRATYPSGLTVEARAVATSAAYSNSAIASTTIGQVSVQLQTPEIVTSAANFVAGSVETISVSLINPNASGATLQYRLNSGSWKSYSSAFNVTRSNYATGLTVEARAKASSSSYLDSGVDSATIGLTAVQLRAPTIAKSAPNFVAGSVENVTITLTNPNSTGSTLQYRLDGGNWQSYSKAFKVTRSSYPSGVTVEARAKASSAAYADSTEESTEVGLTAVQLQTPTIAKSAANFAAGTVESISVTVTNPNSTGSALEYRLNGGSWVAYSAAFNVTRATYPTGLTVEARARATSAAYADSAVASTAIGLTAVQLKTPTIAKSASNFVAGSVESVSITLTNPNTAGSTLEYRLNTGSWQAYSAAFNVTRATYASGVTVEARAKATAAAYTDSATASTTIGLTPVQLQSPAIAKSADNFVGGTVTSISITLTNPNTAGSTLEYRLNAGAWQTYSAAFNVTKTTYPSGLTVEARAKATSAAYLDSAVASTAIGSLPPQKLLPPTISPADSDFPLSSFPLTVSLSNPNTGLGITTKMIYSIQGGAWRLYSSPFTVTANQVVLARTISMDQSKYLDSDNATRFFRPVLTSLTGTVAGSFRSPSGPSGMVQSIQSLTNGSQFKWGTVQYWSGGSLIDLGPQNNLKFVGQGFSNVGMGQRIQVGDLDYFNGSILSGSEANQITLRVELRLTSPSMTTLTSDFVFALENTTNTSNQVASADYVRLATNSATTSQVVNGVRYTIKLEFGSSTSQGFTSLTQFHVYESASAAADLFATITPETYQLSDVITYPSDSTINSLVGR